MIPQPPTTFQADVIPACLRARAQWVCWKYVERDEEVTKCPYSAKTGAKASSTDADTWCTFAEATTAWEQNSQYAGVGYVFAADDPYCGVDLDDCIDPVTGELKPWGLHAVQALDSYSEISPSGTGVKIWTQAVKNGDRCRKAYEDGEVEMYDRGRYFTVTGNRLEQGSTEVEPRQAAVDKFYFRVFGPPPPERKSCPNPPPTPISPPSGEPALTDDKILHLAQSNRKNGSKFSALWAGSWDAHFPSQSEADASVVFTLAFYTKNAAQIDRLFRTSALMRAKWDERHGAKTYGQDTIDKALAQVTEQYQPRRAPRVAAGATNADAAPEKAGLIALGTRDPTSERLVLCPKKTLPTAQAFIEEFYHHEKGRKLHCYAGVLMNWRGNRFVEIEEGALRQKLQEWLHKGLRYLYNKKTQALELVGFESNPSTVNAALESIKAHVHLPATITPPTWLISGPPGPNPCDILPFATGNLHIPTCKILSPTPSYFNIQALDFDFDANAEAPELWIKFLEQLWGDDLESVQLLQEWMGYCLVADTSLQKMLLMVGPRRSGKGTIARVIARLIGVGNVCGPTTSSLAGAFGLQPLIGKSLGIVSDARFGGENIGVVIERLLCISGEDTLTVDRKFLGSVTMRLPTRFMFLTNEIPRLNDASAALTGRFIILRMTKTYYDKEDPKLTAKLLAELPGILLWALEGLKRLRGRGHFVQPQSVNDVVRDLEDLASPVGAFVRERCEIGVGLRAWVDDLYDAWKKWCEADGRIVVSNKQVFGRDLAAAFPGIACRRHSMQGRFYEGIGLRQEGGA